MIGHNQMPTYAIISGSDLREHPDFKIESNHEIPSQYGFASTPVFQGNLKNWKKFLFLARHGIDTKIAPHQVNYRANIDTLNQAGAEAIITINTVGSMNLEMPPGTWVLADQIIDYTHSREQTFFDGVHHPMKHIDFSFPYDIHLRNQLITFAKERKFQVADRGVYGCTQGPRLETAAEIKRLANDGCDIVGMTNMPEAVLARELDIPYVSLCLVANWGAGMEAEPLDIDEIYKLVEKEMKHAVEFVLRFMEEHA